jgi:hypothetical protein
MGLVTRSELILAAKNMTSIIEGLLPAFGKSSEDYWGEYITLVTKMLNVKSTELQQRIESKKLAAARYFEQLKLTVDAPRLENLLATLETTTQFTLDGLEVVEQVCRVCSRLGYMQRNVFEDDATEGRYVLDPRPARFRFRFAYPEQFNCLVCRLSFDQEECGEIDQFEQEVEIEPDEWTATDAKAFEEDQLLEAWERFK